MIQINESKNISVKIKQNKTKQNKRGAQQERKHTL